MSPWRAVDSSDPAWPGRVPLLRCALCASATTNAPAPPEGHDAGAYASDSPRLARVAGPLLRAFDRRRLALLRGAPGGLAPGARLLDVGAGRGRFVASAHAAGLRAEGIEPSARGVRAARERHAVRLMEVDAARAGLASGSFDAVTLWHVLEHAQDPQAMLNAVHDWLVPGGLLLVGVPNLDSLQARLGVARWFHLDVPRHRTHFTPSGLSVLLRRTGFQTLRVCQVLLEHNPFGMWQSLVNRLTHAPSYLYHLLKRNARWRAGDLAITAAALTLVPAAALLELGAGLAGRGGTIAVLARRSAE